MKILSNTKEIIATKVTQFSIEEIEAALLVALGQHGGEIEWEYDFDDMITGAIITTKSFEKIE